MFHLLNKLFNLRNKANPDHEKPFLEHLEDLRIMVTRIILTLLISTLVCWVFRNQLMDILRKPVDDVWVSQQASHLPALDKAARPLNLETWEKTKKIALAIAPLDESGREAFFNQLHDENLRFHVDSYLLYRAALELPKDQRAAFLAASAPSPDIRRQVDALLESGADPLIAKRDDLRMMGAFKPTEGFMLSMKLAFFAGVIISFPLLLYFVLQFVLPGLHEREKKALFPALAIGFALFAIGVCFAYFVVLPKTLVFFHDFTDSMGIVNEWRIGYYISFATQFTLLFGLAFELPVVVMTLVKIGLLNWEMMRHTRGYAVLAIFVVAAVITPTPDAFTLCLLAIPMVALYEICIWLAWWEYKKHPPEPASDEDENDDDGPAPPDDRPDGDAPLPYEPESGETEDTGDSDETDGEGDSEDPYAPYDDPYYETYGPDDDIDPFTEYEDPHAVPEEEDAEKTEEKDTRPQPDSDQ